MKTTSIETSKKLKELGFKRKAHFYWEYDPLAQKTWFLSKYFDHEKDYDQYRWYAYTLEDILEVLPKQIEYIGTGSVKKAFLSIGKKGIGYYFLGFDNNYQFSKQENETLADTAARLLIKLLEDKIINVEEVNLQKPENKNITCTNCRKVFKVPQSEFERHVYKAWFHNDKCKEQYLGL